MSNAVDNIVGMSPKDLEKFRRRIDDNRKTYIVTPCGDIDLCGVLFYDMDLRFVDFWGCDLSRTIFCECNLDGKRFYRTNLLGTVFVNTYVENTDKMGENIEKCGRICRKLFNEYQGWGIGWYDVVIPPTKIDGGFVGYKVLRGPILNYSDIVLAKLWIPADAKRVVFDGGKCRASKVYVEEIRELDDDGEVDIGYSPTSDNVAEYEVGKIVEANGFDESYKECTNGIHFFLTKEEAIEYGRCYC